MPAPPRARSSSSPPRFMPASSAVCRFEQLHFASGTSSLRRLGGENQMNNVIGTPAPAWLRIVAALGLLWNLFGVYAYLQTVHVLPAGEGMAMETMPAWMTAAFAIAVFGGSLGSLGLLLLKRWSKLLLLLSFLAVLAQDVWVVMLREGPADSPILTIVVNLIALLLVWR